MTAPTFDDQTKRLDNGCIVWTGKTQNQIGHGYYYDRERKRTVGAHVYALERATGEHPAGAYALHTCDNPPCVNPDHLYWGTQADNGRDAAARGRIPTGERHYAAILTESQVVEMRRRRARGERIVDIGIVYGVHASYVTQVCTGQRWKHAGGPITPPYKGKLTDEEVREMREAVRAGASRASFREKYGVSKTCIDHIITGRERVKAGGPIKGQDY